MADPPLPGPRGRVLFPVALDGDIDPAVLDCYGEALERAVAVAVRTGQTGLLERADRLAEVIGGIVEPSVALLEERLRRLEAMRAVLEQGDWLTAEQLRKLQPVPPASPSLPASDWKRRGRIYGVSYRGRELYARYQLDEMYQPLAVVKDMLKAFGPVADPWRLAAWFHFPNGWRQRALPHAVRPAPATREPRAGGRRAAGVGPATGGGAGAGAQPRHPRGVSARRPAAETPPRPGADRLPAARPRTE